MPKDHKKLKAQFISKANKVYGPRFDYSFVDYVNGKTKIKIVCPIHGMFEQTPDAHLRGYGCSNCNVEDKFAEKEHEFISEATEVHNNFFDYSLVRYMGSIVKVKIICPIHGVFEQLPCQHLFGRGCMQCCNDSKRMSVDSFILRSQERHGSFYDYSKVAITNLKQKVCIICPIHGEFWQEAKSHLNGCKCPKCAQKENDSYGAKRIMAFLEKYNIKYSREVRFSDCRNQYPLPFDFQITVNGVDGIIEFNGEQHYKGWSKCEKSLAEISHRDTIKQTYLIQNNIPFLVIAYTEIDNVENLLWNFVMELRNTSARKMVA